MLRCSFRKERMGEWWVRRNDEEDLVKLVFAPQDPFVMELSTTEGKHTTVRALFLDSAWDVHGNRRVVLADGGILTFRSGHALVDFLAAVSVWECNPLPWADPRALSAIAEF